MERVLRYINEHLEESIDLQAIANYAGYSIWHFSEKFKKYTGVTFLEYVRNRRMYMALRDLQRGDSVTDVSMRYGYSSLTGFESAFHKVFGSMPSVFLRDILIFENAYESRKAKLVLSPRCISLREEVIGGRIYDDALSGQYLKHYHDGWLRMPPKPASNGKVVAECLCTMIYEHAPLIFEHELLVGHNYPSNNKINEEQRLFQKNFQTKWYEDATMYQPLDFRLRSGEDVARLKRYFENSLLTQSEIQDMATRFSLEDADMRTRLEGFVHDDVTEPQMIIKDPEDQPAVDELASSGLVFSRTHSMINYEKVLKLGFKGIREELDAAMEAHDTLDRAQKDLYENMGKVLDAGCAIGRRYEKAAEQLALVMGAKRAEELKKIAQICARVPEHPAQTLHEAVQSLWFTHILNTWEDGINANSLGRLDQILYPYYRNDMDKGIITRDEAFELICCLWLKLFRDYDVQQCTIGGCDRDGNCAVNELSYLMLDATEALGIIRSLSVRYSNDTPQEFLRRSLEVVCHLQKGVPFFFSDDILIEALTRRGIAVEDARDYAVVGCVEICVPGKTNQHSVSSRVNALKALEYTLGNGRSMIDPGKKPGVETGDIGALTTFPKLMEAVLRQLRHLIDIACRLTNNKIPETAKYVVLPFKSALTDDCLLTGRHYNNGGAKYDYYQFDVVGLINLADSLEALRHFVYDQKKYTLEEVYEQLRNNYPDEEIRREFLYGAPKFGNGQKSVDALASELMDKVCSYIETTPSATGMGFHPQFFSFVWMYEYGRMTAATPDGRRRGDPLSGSISPMQGMDFNGITALIGSLSHLPAKKAPGSISTVLEIDPSLFTDINIDMIAGILKSASNRGSSSIQFNVFSKETLIEAKKHPERYRDLTVCVAGFILNFVSLESSAQDELIQRTKHFVI